MRAGKLDSTTTRNTIMKTKLQLQLTAIAPLVDVHTLWSRDYDDKWDGPYNKDWTEGLNAKDWKCWQSELRASIVKNGELVSGSAYLGGTWEKAGDKPHISNPEISGYEPQMTEEALEELLSRIGKHDAESQIKAALKHVRRVIESSYKAQMQEV